MKKAAALILLASLALTGAQTIQFPGGSVDISGGGSKVNVNIPGVSIPGITTGASTGGVNIPGLSFPGNSNSGSSGGSVVISNGGSSTAIDIDALAALSEKCDKYFDNDGWDRCGDVYDSGANGNAVCPKACSDALKAVPNECAQLLVSFFPANANGVTAQSILDNLNKWCGTDFSVAASSPTPSSPKSPTPSSPKIPTPSSPKPRLPCDLSSLVGLDDVKDYKLVLSVLDGAGLLKEIPSNFTLFLPKDDALVSTVSSLPGVDSSSLEKLLETLGGQEELFGKLVSVLMYHVVPFGSYSTKAQLAGASPLSTLLAYIKDDDQWEFAASSAGLITDGAGQKVAATKVLDLCDSVIWSVDKVLLPAALASIPVTTVAEAVDFLA